MGSVEGRVEPPQRAAVMKAPHDISSGRHPHDDDQHTTADEDSMWSRITSVSRRGFARILRIPHEVETWPDDGIDDGINAKSG